MLEFDRNTNSSKLLSISSLPARMKKIHSLLKALEWSQHYTLILRRSVAANSIVSCPIWPNFELIQAFMDVFVTCKTEDPSKMKASGRLEQIPHFYGDYSKPSGQLKFVDLGRIWSNFKVLRDFMAVDDRIKNEVTTFYMDFPDAQGRLTPSSVMGSGRKSNSSKVL